MSADTPDVIDRLAGIAAGSRLDAVRSARPAARENAQRSYAALFAPAAPGDFTVPERYAVAAFVAALHQQPDAAGFYRSELAARDTGNTADAIAALSTPGAARGPYGSYPPGPLSVEDRAGPTYRVGKDQRGALGPRLCAATEHAHLLVFHPRDASPEALQALLDAGWSTTDIVTLSQLVSFLAFQIRVIAGLRALGMQPGTAGGNP